MWKIAMKIRDKIGISSEYDEQKQAEAEELMKEG